MRRYLFVVLLCVPISSLWAKTVVKGDASKISLIMSSDQGAEMQLQVWQMYLPDVLDKLSQIIKTPIHYSVLPQGKVTATCVTSTIEALLKCLLGAGANIAFHYPQEKVSGSTFYQPPSKVWVLGSVLETAKSEEQCVNNQIVKSDISLSQEKGYEKEAVKLESLLQFTKVENPEQRALAIAKLATRGMPDSQKVTARLMQALDDPSAKVRVQALFGWVFREGKAAMPELMRALDDPEPSVRLKAVGLSNDGDLLNQAASDSNQAVRQYALMKLQAKQIK